MMKPTRSWTTGLGLKTLAIVLLSTLLISCGSGKKYQEFIPTRILSIGDAMSYMSFTGTTAVNNLTAVDPTTTPPQTAHWLWSYASSYGLTSMGTPSTAGANVVFYNNNTDYPAAPTSILAQDLQRRSLGTYADVEAQANRLPTTPGSGDLVILSVGMGDIFHLADTIGSTVVDRTNTSDVNRRAAIDIGLQYARLADSIYQRGYKHVLLVPSFDFSTSPYVATLSATYKNNIYALTEALNIGLMVNCNGGCTSSLDNKPYASRAEGVWKFDVYNYVLNISLKTLGSLQFNVNTTSPLCTAPAQTCSPTSLFDTNSPSLPFYYSGDLFTTPTLHRYIGSFLYAYSRGLTGF